MAEQADRGGTVREGGSKEAFSSTCKDCSERDFYLIRGFTSSQY